MPRISEFFGVVIAMYFSDHNPPHIHAEYAGDEAEFSIDTRNRIAVPNLVIVHENYASFAGRAWRPNEAELARREEQWGRA